MNQINWNKIWDEMADYYNKNYPQFNYLIGQVMKENKAANPRIVRRILAKQIYKQLA